MKLFRLTLMLFLCIVLCERLSAQNQSMSGRDFWVMISPPTIAGESCELCLDSLALYIIGDTAAVGTVDNEHFGFHYDFQVTPSAVTLLKIPLSEVIFDYPNINHPNCYTYNGCSSYRGVRYQTPFIH